MSTNDRGKNREPRDLSMGGFKVHQLEGLEKDNVISAFGGYVDEVLGKINDGKEATVYLCRAAPELVGNEIDSPYLAAKMFRPRKFRNFDNDHTYRNFGKMRDRRMAKAMGGKSNKGQKAFHQHWIESEWRNLALLFEAGVHVPKPYLQGADGILMDYIGNEEGPAPRLVNSVLSSNEAPRVLAEILEDVEKMAAINIVHGDFSAYNILFDGSHHWVIDVPQAVDIRSSTDAYNLLQRDLINIEKYFSKYGLEVPVSDLMRKYL